MTIRSAMALVLILLAGAPCAGQSANYRTIVDRYRSGHYDEAMEALGRLPIDEVERSVREIQARVDDRGRKKEPIDPVWVEAALLLHTHALATPRPSGWPPLHLDELLAAVFGPPVDYTFVRCWYLFMSAYNQGHGGPLMAHAILDHAPGQVTDHPEAQLATGAIHEIGWMLAEEDRRFESRNFTPRLATAEAAYRRALAVAPALHEARLRLGRVLTLQQRYDEALATFAELPADVEPGFAYLARLFEGDAFERRGDISRASAAYLRAIAIMPHAESASLALAHLRHQEGRRDIALERTREVTSGVEDVGTDPWLWYRIGTAWRTNGYLEAMQNIVKHVESLQESEDRNPGQG